MDGNKLKPIQFNDRKIKDPVRYPKVIIPIENKAKLEFKQVMGNMIKKLTKEMVEVKKNGK